MTIWTGDDRCGWSWGWVECVILYSLKIHIIILRSKIYTKIVFGFGDDVDKIIKEFSTASKLKKRTMLQDDTKKSIYEKIINKIMPGSTIECPARSFQSL